MALESKALKLCNCNHSMALDRAALERALASDAPLTVHCELCRGEAGAFNAALGDDHDLLVACTQEAPLFTELANAAGSSAELRFVNVREAALWSTEGRKATPKIAALLEAATLPEPGPVPSVHYTSGRQLLVIGPSGAALDWAERLSGQFEASVLITRSDGGELPLERKYPVWSGRPTRAVGWLGAFDVEWTQDNPIDLELCTRCNACLAACPENAIDFTYQVDTDKCNAHRACVKACGALGAVDFSRAERSRKESFDMVLDLSAEPLLRTPELPLGYAAPGADPLEQALAAAALARLVGAFEKPVFVAYKERLCVHGRSGRTGCHQCLDVCSAGAIRANGEHVSIEPHLCAGCGGCSTVCPSGAISYAYPRVPELGQWLKALLGAYRKAGGSDACIVIHDQEEGRKCVHGIGRRALRGGRGLPARAIPVETYHIASVGLDLLLGTICYGASQVVLVSTGREADEYLMALEAQMRHGEAILNALGYEGTHFALVGASDPPVLEGVLWDLRPARGVAVPAVFNLDADKRSALDFEFDHLARHAPTPKENIALDKGAPFGTLAVANDRCTLCKACIGACPAGALLDAPDTPALRFVERNCVQCGLCADTCPEDAIALVPRLLLAPQARQRIVLNEAEAFNCIRCGKPFGTRPMIDNMLGKLGAHAMFTSGSALRRLQMCGDCRVIDLTEAEEGRAEGLRNG